MTKVYDDDGTVLYHEAPYTEEEELALYAMMANPPVAIARAPLAERQKETQQQQQQQQDAARQHDPEE